VATGSVTFALMAPFNTLQAEGPRSSVPLDDNVVRVGVNYRFGGPVVAKY
jgi:hypothetical protein